MFYYLLEEFKAHFGWAAGWVSCKLSFWERLKNPHFLFLGSPSERKKLAKLKNKAGEWKPCLICGHYIEVVKYTPHTGWILVKKIDRATIKAQPVEIDVIEFEGFFEKGKSLDEPLKKISVVSGELTVTEKKAILAMMNMRIFAGYIGRMTYFISPEKNENEYQVKVLKKDRGLGLIGNKLQESVYTSVFTVK